MNGFEVLQELFSYPFVVNGFIGGVTAAIICSILGVFIVLRRASLIGEGIAHLSFGGIAVGLLAGLYPLGVALVFALIGTVAISLLSQKKLVYYETAIGILFSFGLAIGAIAASLAGGFNVDLFSYLFGNILTISDQDLLYILLLSMAVLAFCLLFYKELVAMTFDTTGARLAGVPVASFDLVFNVMVAFTVVVSIQIVGSLLVSALLIIPAASALQLSSSFRSTVLIGLVVAVLSVVAGLLLSFFFDVATGGAIVIFGTVAFAICVAVRKIAIDRPFWVSPSSTEDKK
jgi:zinc transport system permease protein